MKKSGLFRLKARRAGRTAWRENFAAFVHAAMIEPKQVEITNQRIAISKLPSEFLGFRIVLLSDIHHSQFLTEEEISDAARRANELKPDMIALTGDYVTHSSNFIPPCARALGTLQAPHGVFAVLGNHDHWANGEMMSTALTDQGIRVLCNENVCINKDQSHIRLAGIDDIIAGRDDLAAALLGTDQVETRILLAHNPAIIRAAARAGVDLVLSGHTHGGQINWRLLAGREDRKTGRWLRRPTPRPRGLMLHGHAQLWATQLYVNRGLGTVIVPLRYGCPPEITVIELSN